MIGIYKLISPTDGIYIGQAVNISNRWDKYICLDKGSIGPKLYNSLKKHGWNSFKKEIIEECTLEQLNEKETYHKQQVINEFGWKNALFCELYDNEVDLNLKKLKIK